MINNVIDGRFTSLTTGTFKSVIKPLVFFQLAGQNRLMDKIKQLQFITIAPYDRNFQIWVKIVQRSRNHIRETSVS